MKRQHVPGSRGPDAISGSGSETVTVTTDKIRHPGPCLQCPGDGCHDALHVASAGGVQSVDRLPEPHVRICPETEALPANGSTQRFIAKRYGTTPGNLPDWMKKNRIGKPGA